MVRRRVVPGAHRRRRGPVSPIGGRATRLRRARTRPPPCPLGRTPHGRRGAGIVNLPPVSTPTPAAQPRTPPNFFIPLPRIPSAYTGLANRLSDSLWERRFNITTTGRREIDRPDAHRYESVPYYAIFKILDQLSLQPDDVVVDLGSGMGRPVFVAASYPIRKAIGVEIEPELHVAAVENAGRAKRLRAPVEFHCQSALDFDFREVTVLLLFNPFGGATFRAMLDRVHESLRNNPRTIRIGYVNATCAHIIAECPWIEVDTWWEMSNWSRVKTPVHFYRAAVRRPSFGPPPRGDRNLRAA